MAKIIKLRSSEAINLVLEHYLPEKRFKITVLGEVSLELDMETATEIFNLLFEKDLVKLNEVEFLNEDFANVTVVESSENSEAEQIVQPSTTKTSKEKVLDFLCEVSPNHFSTKEIAEKVGSSYPAVSNSLSKLLNEGKISKDSNKKYFISSTENTALESTNEGEASKVSTEQSDDEKANAEKSSETSVDEEKNVPENSYIEGAKTMLKVFDDENNKDIVNYIFFDRKNNFEVKKIREKFPTKEERISKIIKALAKKEIIIFDEKLPPEGRYIILPLWRIYANLLGNKEPVEKGALRNAAETGIKEFDNLIKQALQHGLVERSEEKRVIRYAVKKAI